MVEQITEQMPSHNDEFLQRIQESAQSFAVKYRPDAANPVPASESIGEALAARIRAYAQGSKMTLDYAGDQGLRWYGKPQDCLCVCANYADIARHNHVMLMDLVAAGAPGAELPTGYSDARPETMEEVMKFLLMRESDSVEQTLSRLIAVNEQIARCIENLSDAEMNLRVDTPWYEQQTVRDLLLIILQRSARASGQAWAILKFQAYGLLKEETSP